MFVRIPSGFTPRSGRFGLYVAAALLLSASCTTDEDTEPHVPAKAAATQPEGGGALLREDDACDRLLSAAIDAYERLGCDQPSFPECPAFIRPGGGSGCYEYQEGSLEACEQIYADATDCGTLAPCFATAVLNLELPTCEQLTAPGAGGAGGAPSGGAPSGGAPSGGAGPDLGGAPAGGAGTTGGADPGIGGAAPQAGSPSGGVPSSGGTN
jgi:hypothetical protein